VGLSLLRPIVPENGLSSNHQRFRGVLANLAGFIAVVRTFRYHFQLKPRRCFSGWVKIASIE